MLVPNSEKAIVSADKLIRYCLDATNEVGKHKAKVFASALGITQINFEVLQIALIEAVRINEAVAGISNSFGDRYIVDFDFDFMDKSARIRSVWIIDHGKVIPRLVTCYVIS